ncbi:hypothetical protein ACHAXH_006059 [Discostella pseudostelligera]|jgi:hypothetical protein
MDNSGNTNCNGACRRNDMAYGGDDDDSGDDQSQPQIQLWQPWPAEALSMAKIALKLTQQEWSQTGLGLTRLKTTAETTPTSSSPSSNRVSTGTEASSTTATIAGERGGVDDNCRDDDENTLNTIVDRIVALLLIRIVALVASRLGNGRRSLDGNEHNNICMGNSSTCRGKRREKIYSDYSTTTICKTALHSSSDNNLEQDGSGECNNSCNKTCPFHCCHRNNNINTFPSQITPIVINQLQQYVTVICRQYPPAKDVPYHNVEHAYHVFISASKLLDLLLFEEEHTTITSVRTKTMAPSRPSDNTDSNPLRRRLTYGLKSNPLAHLAYLFSALVHDVDHKGISNRQLVLEQDDLAILYNDQSVLEQRSLAVAFTTLKGAEYDMLREELFPARDRHAASTSPTTPPITNMGRKTTTTAAIAGQRSLASRGAGSASLGKNEEFLNFRKLVIDLVLVTDIASPERTQIAKSKWKEAFGDVVVAEKLRKRESASTAAATAAAHTTGRSSEITKSSTASPCGSGADGKGLVTAASAPGVIHLNDVVSRLESQTSPRRYGSDSTDQNDSRRHSSCSDRQKNGIIYPDEHQCQQPKFVPSTDFGNKDPQHVPNMSDNVNFYLGESISSSTSSPSLFTIQSNEEDDFDASAVSRTKMNFYLNEVPSSSRSFDSMENLLDAAANYILGGSDGEKEGRKITMNENCSDKEGSRELVKRSSYQSYQHKKYDGDSDDDDDPDLDRAGNSLRWSTGDLSHSDDHHHHQNRRVCPPPLGLSQSVKTSHEMRYVPRRLHKLGVRRALDLAGSMITDYNYNAIWSSRGGSSSELRELNPHHQEAEDIRNEEDDFDPEDDVDEFKATVVLEQMMHAADVAALFQDWENVVEWSTRLYRELNNGYLSNRGDDPSLEWYDNQIKFFDFYILPLAKNLAVMGVFDEVMGERVIHGVKSNMARWIRDGRKAAQKMKEDEEERVRLKEK